MSYKLTTTTKKELECWSALELISLTNKTINEIMIILRRIFKDAKADNIHSDSPIDAIENLPLGERKDPDPFTQTEIEKILSARIRRTQDINTMGFACWSGLRISELIALAWEYIDLNTGTVNVCRASVNGSYKYAKTKRSAREVKLIDPAIQWL